ncbi:MAG TPA: hypothetical protein VEF04_14265 [Blastocatellia bacterium]|nr:hypothetical protein [Blastocatellia bacterium]
MKVLRRVSFAIQLLFALLLIGSAVGKIARFGLREYVIHYTNWMYTLAIVFFVGTLSLTNRPHAVARALQRWLYCPLLGVITGVFVGVTVLLGSGSHFLSSLLATIPASLLILGNEAFHTYPFIAILVYGLAHSAELAHTLRPPIVVVQPVQWLFFFYQMVGGALLSLVIYLLCVDVNQVYDTRLDSLLGLAIFSLVALAISTVPVYWAAYKADENNKASGS